MKTLTELMQLRKEAAEAMNNTKFDLKTRAIAQQYKEELTKRIINFKGEWK